MMLEMWDNDREYRKAEFESFEVTRSADASYSTKISGHSTNPNWHLRDPFKFTAENYDMNNLEPGAQWYEKVCALTGIFKRTCC